MNSIIKLDTDEIDRKSLRLLVDTFEKIVINRNKKLRPYNLGELKEKGIDYIFEIEDRIYDTELKVNLETNPIFYIQNKGTLKVNPQLKGTINKGLIPFQLDKISHIKYFCYELDYPLIITLVDIDKKAIYWLPIQLELEKYSKAYNKKLNELNNKTKKTNSIQIYFDPNKCILKNNEINKDSIEEFFNDVNASRFFLANRIKDSLTYSNNKILNYDKFSKLSQHIESSRLLYLNNEILDSIYNLFNKIIFDEISFIPPHIITKYFLSIYLANVFYDDFKLTIKDDKIRVFFNSFQIENQNNIIADTEIENEKLEFILSKLTNNLFFYISTDNQQIDIRFNKHSDCDCVRCKYENYDFVNINFQIEKSEENDLDKLILKAYINYKVGNYDTSLLIFIKALDLAKQDEKLIKVFFIKTNILRLKQLLRNRNFGAQIDESRYLDFNSINLDSDLCSMLTHPHIETLKWLHSGRFNSDAFRNISDLSKKLREHYKNSISNGYGYNNHINSIYHSFLNYDLFLQNNCIIFDCFNEYNEIIELFIEGLYASHAITSERNSKLDGFNDYLLKILLNNSNTDILIKLFREYKLQELNYITDEEINDKRIHNSILKLISNFSSISELKSNLDSDNDKFSTHYRNKVYNGIVLSAQLNFEDEISVTLFKEIINLIQSNNVNLHSKYIAYFVSKKNRILSDELLINFLNVCLSNPFLKDSRSFEDIIYAIHLGKRTLNFNDIVRENIITFLAYDSKKEIYKFDTDILVDFYIISDKVTQVKIREICKSLIISSFNKDFYQLCVVLDVLEYEENLIDKFISVSFPKLIQEIQGRPVYENIGLNNNSNLDNLFNILFKYDINTNDAKFDFINAFNLYYQWLKDLEGFDYIKFDPKWITLHTTKYYFKAFYNSFELKNNLENYIQSDASQNDQEVMNSYLNIYVRKTWE